MKTIRELTPWSVHTNIINIKCWAWLILAVDLTAWQTDQFSLTAQFYDCFVWDESHARFTGSMSETFAIVTGLPKWYFDYILKLVWHILIIFARLFHELHISFITLTNLYKMLLLYSSQCFPRLCFQYYLFVFLVNKLLYLATTNYVIVF